MKRSMYLLSIALCALCASCALSIHAQEAVLPPISTERPSAGPSADVLPAGSLQTELGTGLSLQRQAFTADLPETLLRIGVTNRLEFRYLPGNFMLQHAPLTGFARPETADSGFSAKLLLAQPNKLVPRSAIVALGLPTGGPDQTSGSYDPGVSLIWTQALPRGYSLIEVAQGTFTTFNGSRHDAWTPSLGVGRTFSTALSGFGEYAPSVLADNTYTYIVDGGLTYAPSPLKQFDMRAGYLHDAAGFHTLLSVGYSRRFDHFFGLPGLFALRH